jgi:hypothetical protein
LESILSPASKLKPTLKHKNQNRRENSNLNDGSDEEIEFMYDDETETISSKKTKTMFVLKDESVHGLQDILSVVENTVITVKETFHGKPINILIDTGCDIVCISSCIASQSE